MQLVHAVLRRIILFGRKSQKNEPQKRNDKKESLRDMRIYPRGSYNDSVRQAKAIIQHIYISWLIAFRLPPGR